MMEETMACFCCDKELPEKAFLEWEPGLCVICLRVDQWLGRVQARSSTDSANRHDTFDSVIAAGGVL